MTRATQKERAENDRMFDAGIEWIIARQLAPIEDELMRLRAHVAALHELVEPG